MISDLLLLAIEGALRADSRKVSRSITLAAIVALSLGQWALRPAGESADAVLWGQPAIARDDPKARAIAAQVSTAWLRRARLVVERDEDDAVEYPLEFLDDPGARLLSGAAEVAGLAAQQAALVERAAFVRAELRRAFMEK